MMAEHVKPALVTKYVKKWIENGRIHHAGDKPAVIWDDGSCEWHVYGLRHRNHGKPAEMYAMGLQGWWSNGRALKFRSVTNFDVHSMCYAFLVAIMR